MTIMRAVMIGTLASALPLAAQAADFAAGPAADVYASTPASSWTGLYVGAHIGYGSGETSLANTGNNSPVLTGSELDDRDNITIDEDGLPLLWVITECNGADCNGYDLTDFIDDGEGGDSFEVGEGPYLNNEMDMEGMFGGLQLGYNYQMGSVVLGVVGDASVSTMSGNGGNRQNDEDVSPDNVTEDFEAGDLDANVRWEPMPQSNHEAEINWLATLRARAGFLASSNWLLYVHGGLAAGDVEVQGVGTVGPYAEINHSDIQVGWTVGFGTEVMMTDRISLFAEYGYTDLGSADVSEFADSGPGWDIETDTSFHAVKAGINWRLTN